MEKFVFGSRFGTSGLVKGYVGTFCGDAVVSTLRLALFGGGVSKSVSRLVTVWD